MFFLEKNPLILCVSTDKNTYKKMGKVLSVATRKIRRFNAENRAHRYLDKEKIEPAPKYKSNISDYQRVLEGRRNNFFYFF